MLEPRPQSEWNWLIFKVLFTAWSIAYVLSALAQI